MRLLFQTTAAAACVIACACSSMPPSPYGDATAAPNLMPGVEDGRGRFREIFCAILDRRVETLPDHRPCEEALTRVGPEPAGTGQSVELGQSRRRLVAAVVEGVGWNCFSNWLNSRGSGAEHVRQFGYDAVVIGVESLSSSTANAREIRDAIMAMEPTGTEPEVVLIGYSKGSPDILEAVVDYPEIRPRIAAVVSVAGAVRGSPFAEKVTQSKLEFLRKWPGADCSKGDRGAIQSLQPDTRKAWLERNQLPPGIPFYTLATCPEPERVSRVLKSSYKKLSRIDARNDGMMLFDDQLVPGGTFMGCVNADHWAVSVPIARTHPKVAAIFVDKNDYPREALLEALLRYVEEDLTAAAR